MILHCQSLSNQSSLKDFVPIISSIVVILLFITDRIIGYYYRRKEVERNWYLKILIEPNIDKISDFYKSVNELYTSSSDLLKLNSEIKHSDYISCKSTEFGKFQTLKREFEAEVILSIQMRYLEVGEKITEELRNLEDLYTTSLDQEIFTDENIKSFQISLANNRALILNILYTPLKVKPWFFFWK